MDYQTEMSNRRIVSFLFDKEEVKIFDMALGVRSDIDSPLTISSFYNYILYIVAVRCM